MPKPLRIFISSPGDVSTERRRAALVVESLKKEFARFFDITAYLWEHEAMLATGHFQDVIEPPSQSDIVVMILWSRLGTPLPEKSAKREYRGLDGRTPVTGTEWEYEDALEANRTKGAPDLLVYRSNREPQISLRDPQKKQLAENQWSALEGFWSRYFQSGGVFLSAYHGFEDLEDFGDMLEAHLRQLIRSRIEKGRIEAGADIKATWLQSPFRGLSAYDFEHAPIFFGRGAAQLKAVEQVVRNANEGRAFLLVLGASGSGKSSLVRAGLLPNLFARGVADGAGLWRRVAFKPGDADGNLFLGLAKALVDDRVKEGAGIPEILGPGVTIDQLENALRRSMDDPGFVFTPALARITQEARASGRIMGHESAKLAIVLDQLEEIFTDASISTEERNSFIRLISSLSKTGKVWVIATMRSDFWHKAAATPELVELASGTGKIDLLPPSQAELAEMIRRPAAAAGLSFEDHSETRIGLDAIIAEEAARDPGSLPLVSFVLDALYKADVERARGGILRYETYEALGGLKGAIATRAEEILNAQPADVQAAMPSVLRALVTVGHDRDSNATARMTPLSGFPVGSPRRALVDAFLDPQARLLIADGDGGEARVRVAHEALINHWSRAREQINRDRRDLETRARLEEDEALWRAAAPADKEARLLDGLALEEGKDLVAKWDEELPASLKQFIEQSRVTAGAKRNRRFRILVGVAAVMAVLAVLSAGAGFYALQQSSVAQAESARARTAEAAAELQLKETERGSARLIARQSSAMSNDGQSEIALTLAAESVRLAQKADPDFTKLPLAAVAALQNAASADTIVSVLSSSQAAISDADFGSDFRTVYTGDTSGNLTVWDTFSGTERAIFGRPEQQLVSAVADWEGAYLAITYSDKILQMYDGSTLELKGNGIVLEGNPTALAMDRGGRGVITGDDLGNVKIVVPSSQEVLKTEKAHEGPVTYAGIAEDLSIAVTSDGLGNTVIWDLSTLTQRKTVTHNLENTAASAISEVVVSPIGNQFVLIGQGWASVFNAQGELLQRIHSDDSYLYKVLYTPDGASLLYSSGKTVRMLSTADFTEQKVLSGHTFDVRGIELSRDGRRVLTSSGDNTIRLWDLASASTLRLFRSPTGSISGQGLSGDGNYVVAVFDDGNAVVWAVEGLAPVSARLVHTWNVNSLVWSPNGGKVLTSGGDGNATLSEIQDYNPEFRLATGASNVNTSFYTPDGREIVTADDAGRIKLWSAIEGSEIRTIATLPAGYLPNWATITPDGKQILAATYGGVKIYDKAATEGAELRTLNASNSSLFTLSVSADGKKAASGALDGGVFIWDIASGELDVEIHEHRSQINASNFSPDGKWLLTASSDRTIRTWDASTGAPGLVMNGHDDLVMWANFSRDGQRIVSASFDGTVRIWDANTGAELMNFAGGGKPFRTAEFNNDGTVIAAAGDDRRLYLWTLPEKNMANTPTGAPVLAAQLYADDGKMLKEMISWVPLTVSKPLSPGDRRVNFLQPDPSVRVFEPESCGLHAAYQSDPGRQAPGVKEGWLSAADAEGACRRALEAAPDDPRLRLQLGRALIAAGKPEEGLKEVRISADAGYPGGVYYLGFYGVTNPDSSADDMRKGWENVRRAWDMGVPDAGDLIASYLIAGQKKDDQEIIKIDEKAGIEAYRQSSAKGSWFSSIALAGKYEYGENGLEKNMEEALYHYALAARQIEIGGFVQSTEARNARYLFARRASIARQLIRAGKSAEVAAIADRVNAWSPPAPAQQAAAAP
jgi:WD40 repeat protein